MLWWKPGQAARALRKLSQSGYVSRRSSIGGLRGTAVLDSTATAVARRIEAHPEVSAAPLVLGSKFSGTVLVAAASVPPVSDLARAYGLVLGTCVREEEARIRVSIPFEHYEAFIAGVGDVTGMDFSVLRDDVAPDALPGTQTTKQTLLSSPTACYVFVSNCIHVNVMFV